MGRGWPREVSEMLTPCICNMFEHEIGLFQPLALAVTVPTDSMALVFLNFSGKIVARSYL